MRFAAFIGVLLTCFGHALAAPPCHPELDPNGLTDEQASVQVSPTGLMEQGSTLSILSGQRGTFSAESHVFDPSTEAAVSSTRIVEVEDQSMTYRIDFHAHIPDNGDPNALAVLVCDPNDFNLNITYRNAVLAPAVIDVTVAVSVIIYPQGGSGSLQASVFDLTCTNLNGPPLMQTAQETFTVAKGDQVPLSGMIQHLGYEIGLYGSGTVSGSVFLSYAVIDDYCPDGGGGGSGSGGDDDNTGLGGGGDGCDNDPTCRDQDDDTDSDSDEPGDDSDPTCDPPGCCDSSEGGGAPSAGPTHDGGNFRMSVESGRIWTDVPIVTTYAAGREALDLKMAWRGVGTRFLRTNYDYFLWATCEDEPSTPPRKVAIYSPVDFRYTNIATNASTWLFKWNAVAGKYEQLGSDNGTLTYEYEAGADERVFRLKNVRDTVMTFRGQPCDAGDEPDDQGSAYLAQIQDRRGRITRVAWTNQYLVDTITDPWGREVDFESEITPAGLFEYTKTIHPAEDPNAGMTQFSVERVDDVRYYTITDPTGAHAKYQLPVVYPYHDMAERKKNGRVFSAKQTLTQMKLEAYPDADPNAFEDPNSLGEPEIISNVLNSYGWDLLRDCPLQGACRLYYRGGLLEHYDGEERATYYFRDANGIITNVRRADVGNNDQIIWSMSYDTESKRPLVKWDGMWGAWRYSWNDDKFMTRKTPPLGDHSIPEGSWNYEYHPDFRDKLTRKIKPDGAEWVFTYYEIGDPYNRHGLLNTKLDPEGGLTTYDYRYYDADEAPGSASMPLPGRIMWKERVEPDGVLTRWEYSPEGHTTSIVMSSGGVVFSRVEFDDYTPLGLPRERRDYRAETGYVTTRFEYDNMSRLTRRTIDPNGLAIEWQYTWDGEGYLTQTTDPEGLIRRFTYDHRNRLIEVEVDGGSPELIRTVSYEYDKSSRLTKIIDSKDQETTLEYNDPPGRLTRIIDREGNETELTYYPYVGRSLKGGRDLIKTITRTIDPPLTAEDYTVSYIYDPHYRPILRTVGADDEVLVTEWGYNSAAGCGCGAGTPGGHLPHKIKDSTGAFTYVHYDQFDRPTKVVRKVTDDEDNGGDADDAITTIDYDAAGYISRIVDADGVTMTREYDWADLRVTQHLDPNGFDLTAVFEFDMAGNLIKTVNPAGNVYLMTYDNGGRRTSVLEEITLIAGASYDKVGRMMSYHRGSGWSWSVERNGLGQVTKLFDPLVESPVDKFTAFLYDPNGNLTSRTDREGHVTLYDYDALDRIRKVTEDAGGIEAETEATYNGLGQLTMLCDSDCNETHYSYDRLGRLTTITLPDFWPVTLDYADWRTSRRVHRTDQRGITTTYKFDELYHLTSRSYDSGDPRDMFAWTKAGRLVKADRGPSAASLLQSSTFTWDSAGRIDGAVQEFVENGGLPAFNFSVDNLIDPDTGLDQRTLTYPNPATGAATGRAVTHTWDDRGRLTSVTDSNLGPVLNNVYTVQDLLLAEVVGDSLLRQAYTYDTARRLVSIDAETIGGETHYSRTLGHDAVGNRLFSRNGVSGEANLSELYGYDGLYRLTDFQRGQLNPAGDAITGDPPADTLRSQSWTELDNNGNWIESEWAVQRDGSVETHDEERVVDGVNEIATRYLDDDDPNTPLEQISISYDLAGNLTHDEEYAYHYDALSRLRSVYTITGVAVLHIKYDALGRAVERQVGQNGPVTYYVYDVPTPGGPNGYAVAQEYDDDNELLREFIHRSGHLRPVAMVDYTDAGAISAGLPETFWYLYDERGSVIAITDNAGAVVEQYRYDPYGGATVYDGAGAVIATWTDPNSWDDAALTPSAIGNPYGFTGHRFSVAGLYETPFRAYSPELGRWLQRDPLGYVDGMNLYQYVLSNPFVYFDPFGLDSIPHIQGELEHRITQEDIGPDGEFELWEAEYRSHYENAQHELEVWSERGMRTIEITIEGGKVVATVLNPMPGDDVVALAQAATKLYKAIRLLQKGRKAAKAAQCAVRGGAGSGPKVPRPAPPANDGVTKRPHGGAKHNAAIDEDAAKLREDPLVTDVRKHQVQVDANGNVVGNNIPDLQHNKGGVHYVDEYDTRPKVGEQHRKTIQANDPKAVVRNHDVK